MSVLIQVGVSYDSDLEKVEKVTIEVPEKLWKKSREVFLNLSPLF